MAVKHLPNQVFLELSESSAKMDGNGSTKVPFENKLRCLFSRRTLKCPLYEVPFERVQANSVPSSLSSVSFRRTAQDLRRNAESRRALQDFATDREGHRCGCRPRDAGKVFNGVGDYRGVLPRQDRGASSW